ncbi:MAG: Ribonuclease BN-like family protein [Syntrophorhabdus sp. PtaB.Bin184]|jgi:YihY family inner membrane protein|nr:MAG: Ribonuclease BN-like family protein [Syntrophorhabdus sp. PtaB.Bin184]
MNRPVKKMTSRGLAVSGSLAVTVKKVFKKYQADHANIMVSSIAFYILLTFIPFTLFSFFILGYVIDVGHTGVQMEKYIARTIPAPYNAVIVKKVLREINVISLSKRLSGPLGLLFLLLFTSRLFAVLRPSFQLMFGKTKKGFIKGKQEEFILTLAFAFIQTIIFFSYVFSVMMQVKVVKAFGGAVTRASVVQFFSILDLFLVAGMFHFLYYVLTPVRDRRKLLFASVLGAAMWHLGKYFFQYFVLYIGRFTAFFGTYGVFIAFLFWVYFSVFVFIACAELLSVSSEPAVSGPRPNYARFRWKR